MISAIAEKQKALSLGRALLVGISGIDASGKGFITAKLAHQLENRGWKIVTMRQSNSCENRNIRAQVFSLPERFLICYTDDVSLLPGGNGGGMPKEAVERAATAVATSGPEPWVEEHGDCLYGYALARVRKPELAQDLVQETFLAAVRNYEKFSGQSSVRSWLCGILKHKLCDYYRKAGRETSFTDLEFLEDECSEKFVPEGYWVHMNGPKEWKPEADEVTHRDEFWQTMRECLGKLPERVATVFMMREMDEIESKEICATLSISDSNLWVMLHRARMALRECLAVNWFENPEVKH